MMIISYITLFPDIITHYMSHSLLAKKQKEHVWTLQTIALRDFAMNKHQNVDDTPYGGGAGMVIKAEVCHQSILYALKKAEDYLDTPQHYQIIIPSPHGALFTQDSAKIMSTTANHIIFICGRYEGIDERVADYWKACLYSVGDYVTMGGELPALLMGEAILRLVPSVVGNHESLGSDSYEGSLLEYPHYTKPREWQGLKVPDVLLQGHHQHIEQWRHQQREYLTQKHRPDLWNKYQHSQKIKK